MLLSEFSQARKIIPCPRTIIFNGGEQNNWLGDVLNSGDIVDYQEDYGFRGPYFKIPPTPIDDYTRNKCLNMQL